jgi:predicted nucleotidyltransferase
MELSANDQAILRAYFTSRPIRRAYIFGSYARREAKPQSDIDIMVELDHSFPIGMRFFSFQGELEKLLHKKVDLVSADGLSRHVRPYIEKDKVLIYER